MEFFQGAEPCRLCVYQRIPYFIVILLATSYLLIQNENFKKITFLFYILIFFSSLIIAIHHIGVEKNLWGSFASCETNFKKLPNENLKEYLLNKDYVSCSDVSIKFLGVSLAGYNAIVSFVMLLLSVVGLKKISN